MHVNEARCARLGPWDNAAQEIRDLFLGVGGALLRS